MTVTWDEISIDEIKSPARYSLAMGPFGSNIKTDNFVPEGVPVIRGGNLSGDRFKDFDFVFITEEKADELKSANAFSGDLVFTHRGTLGQVGIIPKTAKYPRYVVSQSQMKLSCDTSKVDPLFVYYFFRSKKGQHELLSSTSTTGVPAISSPLLTLRNIRIPYPPLPIQRRIAHILGTLDDKIELNRRMNETLEAMARAIFKSWFVDFDPVRAKAEGRQPAGMDAETAALFPDGFEEVEGREVPRGWRSQKLKDILIIMKKSINPSQFPDKIFNYFSIPAFDEGKFPKSEEGSLIKSNKFLVTPDSILISKLNPEIPRIWLPHIDEKIPAICSTEFLVCIPRLKGTREFIYSLFNSVTFYDNFKNLVTGTSKSHQRVKSEYLLELKCILPPLELMVIYSILICRLQSKIILNQLESRTLAQIRDTLLPKLMSGEIDVSQINTAIQESV